MLVIESSSAIKLDLNCQFAFDLCILHAHFHRSTTCNYILQPWAIVFSVPVFLFIARLIKMHLTIYKHSSFRLIALIFCKYRSQFASLGTHNPEPRRISIYMAQYRGIEQVNLAMS